jgi:DhnA family fructose-bisphosphate aldolase class Ia
MDAVLRVSGGTSILSELSNEGLVTTMEDAVRLNAAGVALSIYVGSPYERQTLLSLAALVDGAAQSWGADWVRVADAADQRCPRSALCVDRYQHVEDDYNGVLGGGGWGAWCVVAVSGTAAAASDVC